jgi:hypothetical protein
MEAMKGTRSKNLHSYTFLEATTSKCNKKIGAHTLKTLYINSTHLLPFTKTF